MQGMKEAAEIEAVGGSIVGGIAYLNNREVGRWNGGNFYLEPGNEELIEAAKAAVAERKKNEAEAAAAVAAANAPPAPVKVTKTAKVEAPATTPVEPPTGDVAALIAGIDNLPK